MNKKFLAAGMAGCAFLATAAVSPALASARPLDNAQFFIENDTTAPMVFDGFTDDGGQNAFIFNRDGNIAPGDTLLITLVEDGDNLVKNTADYHFADGSGAVGITMMTYNEGSGNSMVAHFNNGKYSSHTNNDDLPTYKLYITPAS
ncbi:hypothetical protein A5662_17745 [Mycobacteriaceae bacterium 1482268.1]|nr:hypothetical protein A5662_17745 [Mycobacteriaceae bacterium 1482268.1]